MSQKDRTSFSNELPIQNLIFRKPLSSTFEGKILVIYQQKNHSMERNRHKNDNASTEGLLNNSRHRGNTCHVSDQAHHGRECSKTPNLPEGFVQSALGGVEGKATAVLTPGAYASYVSANAAKSGKSVSPKAAKGRTCLAEARNAAGGPSTRTGFFSTFPQRETRMGERTLSHHRVQIHSERPKE